MVSDIVELARALVPGLKGAKEGLKETLDNYISILEPELDRCDPSFVRTLAFTWSEMTNEMKIRHALKGLGISSKNPDYYGKLEEMAAEYQEKCICKRRKKA